MGSFAVTINFDMDKAASLSGNMLAAMKKAQQHGVKLAADVIVGALRQTSSQGPLNARTGLLARSWKAGGVNPDADGFSVAIKTDAKNPPPGAGITAGSNVPYANIHEEGGVIRPVKAKALTIPIGANTDDGARKGPARYPTVQSLKDAMGAKNVFSFKGAGSNILWAKKGKTDRSIKPYFLLAKQVRIPASHYVSFAITFGQDEAFNKFQGALDNVK